MEYVGLPGVVKSVGDRSDILLRGSEFVGLPKHLNLPGEVDSLLTETLVVVAS